MMRTIARRWESARGFQKLSGQVSGPCGDATAPRTVRALTRRAIAS